MSTGGLHNLMQKMWHNQACAAADDSRGLQGIQTNSWSQNCAHAATKALHVKQAQITFGLPAILQQAGAL